MALKRDPYYAELLKHAQEENLGDVVLYSGKIIGKTYSRFIVSDRENRELKPLASINQLGHFQLTIPNKDGILLAMYQSDNTGEALGAVFASLLGYSNEPREGDLYIGLEHEDSEGEFIAQIAIEEEGILGMVLRHPQFFDSLPFEKNDPCEPAIHWFVHQYAQGR